MKVSQLTNDFIIEFLKLDTSLDEDESEKLNTEITAMLEAAVKFATGYTGLPRTSEDETPSLDSYDDITFAVLAVISDMNENRVLTLDKPGYTNQTAECILSMYSFNLI